MYGPILYGSELKMLKTREKKSKRKLNSDLPTLFFFFFQVYYGNKAIFWPYEEKNRHVPHMHLS